MIILRWIVFQLNTFDEGTLKHIEIFVLQAADFLPIIRETVNQSHKAIFLSSWNLESCLTEQTRTLVIKGNTGIEGHHWKSLTSCTHRSLQIT